MNIGDPKRDYAAEWRAWRKARGWTPQQMAQTLGLTRKTVDNIEAGRHRPALRSRTKLAELQQRYQKA